MAVDLNMLIRKRGAVKSKMTCFAKYLELVENDFKKDTCLEERSVVELQVRVDRFERILDEFDEIQMNIEVMCEEHDIDNQQIERSDFTDLFNKYLSAARFILRKCEGSKESKHSSGELSIHSSHHSMSHHSMSHHSMSANVNELNVRLPSINLPKYFGDINNWMEFKDTYESLIHNSESIGEIQKFHYLRASLGNDPLKVIQSIDFRANKYQLAWELLCNRYDNSRILVNSHLKGLFTLPSLTKESAEGLRDLLDGMNKHLRALKSLELPTEHWDALVIYIITMKLDKPSGREWEKVKVSGNNLPDLNQFKQFLNNRADFLATCEGNQRESRDKGVTKHSTKNICLVSETSDNPNKRKCNLCNSPSHAIYTCEKFLKLNTSTRWENVNKLKLCSNCLCKGHFRKNCKLGPCKRCRQKHSSLLHDYSVESNTNVTADSNHANTSISAQREDSVAAGSSNQGENVKVSLSSQQSSNVVLLSTAQVRIYDVYGNAYNVRAILDSGSQSCYISEDLCKKLNLKTTRVNISVMGLNNVSTSLTSKCQVSIHSIHNQFSATISCLVLSKITNNLPEFYVNTETWNIPKNLVLADPQFNTPDSIELLIGANLFYDLLLDDKISLGKNMPTLQNTVLGYVISGQIPPTTSSVQSFFVTNQVLHDDLQKFWAIEETKFIASPTDDDELCEHHFRTNTSRTDDGHFMVKIPLKHPITELGNSKYLALKRFYNLERRFQRDGLYKKQYVEFMEEYLQLGHMSPVPESDNSNVACFLPHHGIIKENLTTKLRVVFDGSSITSSGKSLNNIQFIGPSIQNNIFEILVRFRQHKIVVTSDIEKMYRCILVHPDDRTLQQIVWRNEPTQPISTYQLNTVTYGTASAPYLAIRCLRQLALENQHKFPDSCRIIMQDFYVDDLITGFDNEEQAKRHCEEISKILTSAHFKLRKWMSNTSTVLDQLKDDSDYLKVLNLADHEAIKTLGIQWISDADNLCFRFNGFSHQNSVITKRNVLSCIAKTFDPLGLLSPIIILLKILMQRLWSINTDWDDILPNDLQKVWVKFQSQLYHFNKFEIPRHVLCHNPTHIEMHGFCDASQRAYSAAIYLRSVDSEENIQVQLLCGKTKIAPTKSMTTPRLELCGALLLAKLASTVVHALTCSFKIYFWCDSQIVLYWINSDPSTLQTFVANRVSEIRILTDSKCWNYINTKENPADIASRGVFPEDLVKSKLWWFGPSFLKTDNDWPETMQFSSSFKIPETKNKSKSFLVTNMIKFPLFDRFSDIHKLKGVHAYCLRFISNLRKLKEIRQIGPLSVSELNLSMISLVKIAQIETFGNEIKTLQSLKCLKPKHRLLSLSPFVDSNGLLRVGGRLNNSFLDYGVKHPILLDGKHKLTRLIFQSEHLRLLHAGPQLLLASIRQKYWPTSGMSVAKSIVKQCIKCLRFNPRPCNAIMADLPKHRVNVSKPFSITGLDYCGPLTLKDRKGRGSKTYKGYICLFICFASKAVHLELVTDLSTETFIAALRRFASRRGTPSHLYSDNATTFTGAQRVLKSLHDFLSSSKDVIIRYCAGEGIVWKFIPPNSPNFGGLWESNIKGVKHHLLRVIGETILTYEEFSTLLVQVEATLNSRPLYPLSNDPNELEPLTPAHFLIGQPLTMIPAPEFDTNVRLNQLSRYQMIQQMHKGFWNQWSKLYLHHLQQRNKWRISSNNLTHGQVVLIKHDNLPPCKWLMGRIVEVHPGSDGIVRVVTVRTATGLFKRAISKICPLPICETAPKVNSSSDSHNHANKC